MWSPTHVQVTVKRATKLQTKGNNGTNDCFVTIELGKEKFQTSLKPKSPPDVEWNEECDLAIPNQGNTAEIVLTAYHRNMMSIDQFLGQVRIPLSDFKVHDRPKSRLYKLEAKKGKENKKDRGMLEVRVGFTVKSGSLTNLNKKEKHKSSLDHLASMKTNIASSLLSLSSIEKRKGLGKVAHSLRKKIKLPSDKHKGDLEKHKGDSQDFSGSFNSVFKRNDRDLRQSFTASNNNVDPGVISEDEDEFAFDDLSHGSSSNSLRFAPESEQKNASPKIADKPEPVKKEPLDEWSEKLIQNKSNTLPIKKSMSIANIIENERKMNLKNSDTKPEINVNENVVVQPIKKGIEERRERIVVGETDSSFSEDDDIPLKVKQQFQGKSKTELIKIIVKLQENLDKSKQKTKELECYVDEILARVMDTSPNILQRPYQKHDRYSYVL